LNKKGAAFRIESGGNPVDRIVVRKLRQPARIGKIRRQRVPVGHEIKTVVLLLQSYPVL
jgi:hypothetical protein